MVAEQALRITRLVCRSNVTQASFVTAVLATGLCHSFGLAYGDSEITFPYKMYGRTILEQ